MIKYQPKKIEILIAMAKKGFNQKSLSESAGVNEATLSLFLNGKRTISAPTARNIAEALECELEDLFEFKISNIRQEV
ncbi:helix-turn-helix domain-containing protein [Sediminibacillus terrae]|uniref:helix-turn-helix domain-containing protein n=1 Tax=Sediminibacillus terrae TaxID=1562106 RepID=UPI0012964071|nr:helix-turn-helix transcriptional regulator [Sediminibacillus terrae]